jgi:hypothetical protein
MTPVRAKPATTVVTLAASNTSLATSMSFNVKYLLIADVDCWIDPINAAASQADFYVPAKYPMIVEFAGTYGAFTGGVWGSGAGKLYITQISDC